MIEGLFASLDRLRGENFRRLASVDVAFPDIKQVDLTRIAVRLSTDAINDAVLADDSYPR